MKKITLSLVLILVPALALADVACIDSTAELPLTFQQASQIPVLPVNFHKVTGSIYRGARIADQINAQAIVKFGFKTVINLQGGDYADSRGASFDDLIENPLWKNLVEQYEPGESPLDIKTEQNELDLASIAAGLKKINYQPIAIDSINTVTQVEAQKIQSIMRILTDPKTPTPIYVHCAHGADRTGLIMALYRVQFQHICPVAAKVEWDSLGHDWTHEAFTFPLDDFYWNYLFNQKLAN